MIKNTVQYRVRYLGIGVLLFFIGCSSMSNRPGDQVCSDLNTECSAQCRHVSSLSESRLRSRMQPDSATRCQAECAKKYEACMQRVEKNLSGQ